ncbi:LysR substrate-binding domain-containing protein [Marinomonas sp. 15G1-11]|uniref:LysR substrate-binding domain-containing protein n=1 Tax=Marinomonas phaeophyticola TaxID=3004091 RepID=A0ABT4JYX4_9GAMM|nr:LysR substrate-binding domain-containing protein [Marinomonas sp. 15G1-11]MCZ2723607.1 LysR substrate-binding domain-containing protein [Marinomonas sp. 15G1-11]
MRKKDLPSFSSLVAFEAAARYQSFKRAAEEVCVSQAAISRQIRLLEENLGGELFDRNHKHVSLNSNGKLFLDAVSLGLSHIETAANQLRNRHELSTMTIGLMSSIAGLFLAPRIGDFKKLYPEIDMYVVSLERSPNPQKDHFDIMITMGEEPSSSYESTYFFSEEIFPVCSPRYLEKNSKIESIQDLVKHTLLNTDDNHWKNLPWTVIDWNYWFEQNDVPYTALNGLSYNSYPMMINTVLSGHGICLGWKHLVNDLIRDGSLVKPVKETLLPKRDHYLLIRKAVAQRKDIAAFKEWFLEQIKDLEKNED